MTAPVAIVGNGPVGQTAALLLARRGVPSLVLDQRSHRDPVGSKAICQHRDVLDIWDSVGVGRTVADEGVTWSTARTFYRDQELFATDFIDRGHSPFPPFVNISQSRTEQLLDQQLDQESDVDVRWSHEVIDIEQDESGVDLTCRTAGGPVRVRAGYVLMCAGPSANELRSQLDVRFDGHSFDDKFLICDIRADLGSWATERRFYFDPEWNPGRQVLIHPCPDRTYRIDWQVPPEYDVEQEARSGALDERIRKIVGSAPYEIVWRSVYRFHSRLVDRMKVGRVLLAGDVAHLMAPFGARGLNSGVQDAENAAWKLAYVHHGWAPPALLDSYHAERHAAAVENLDVTSTTMAFLVPQTPDEADFRTATLRHAASDAAARSRVDSGRLAEPFWYVQSPLTTPDPTRPFAGRPPRGYSPDPGPGVLVPDLPIAPSGQATRLRQLAREGLLVVTGPGVPPEPAGTVARARTAAPVRSVAANDLVADGATGSVASTLGMRDGEMWLIRPDGHVAAVVSDLDALAAAATRVLGHDPQEVEPA
ncbi:MAG: FAD-dependent monooxygenase [bacterium]